MLNKLEHFIECLRWKAFFFDQKNDEVEDRDGLQVRKNTPTA